MSTKSLFNVFIAGAIVLPALFSGVGIANAQKFMSRQAIVDGLQLTDQQKKKLHRQRRNQRAKVRHGNARNHQKFAKKRAPGRRKVQTFRAPAANSRIAARRAPGARLRNPQIFRAPNSRVALRRAPGTNNAQHRFSRSPGATKFRAPGPVAARRAPASHGGNHRFRAPGRAPNIAAGRAPARAPQRFDNQFASTSGLDNQRGIRFVEQTSAYPEAASVDLEILFDYDSARISPKSVRQLITLGEALQDAALNGTRIMIAGHTDAAGNNAYNNDLSFRRARSVSDFLANYTGISADRLVIEGYGEELLKFPDAPHSGQNRRVEIINLGA